MNVDKALTDHLYKFYFSMGWLPASKKCQRRVGNGICNKDAPFKLDHLAARYECEDGHATAAMYADPNVTGGNND